MVHDFEKYPELTTTQMGVYYFMSPHAQILQDFDAEVVDVHDGDTVKLKWRERDFDFPIRFINIQAPELKDENGNPSQEGRESQKWLENKILNENVQIKINPHNRVDKWGRLLGYVIFQGIDIGEESINAGKSVHWSQRGEMMPIPNFEKEMKKIGL